MRPLRITYLGWDDRDWRGTLIRGLKDANIEVLTRYSASGFKYVGSAAFIIDLIRKSLSSNVVLGDYASDMGYLATRMAKVVRKPVLIYARGGDVDTHDPSFRTNISIGKIKYALKNADIVMCFSRYIMDRALELYPQSNVRLVYHGIDTDQFHPRKGSLRFRLLEVAYLVKRKGIETQLKAMQMIIKEFPKARLTIVGGDPTGHKKNLIQLVNELGIEKYVDFVGHVPHEAMPEVFREHDVFVHTPYHEPFGVVLAEALASGLPIVATATGGIPESVPPEFLIRVGDHRKLAEKVCEIFRLTDEERWNIGARNRQVALQRFTVKRQVQGVVSAIREAIMKNHCVNE